MNGTNPLHKDTIRVHAAGRQNVCQITMRAGKWALANNFLAPASVVSDQPTASWRRLLGMRMSERSQ